MKVLFMHNSLAEYRLEFWRILGKYVELSLLITSKDLDEKIYNLNKDLHGLNVFYLTKVNKRSWLDRVKCYDVIVLPPIDDFRLFRIGYQFAKRARKFGVKTVLWSEAWQWNKMPLIKAIYKKELGELKKIISNLVDICIVSGSKAYEYFIKLGIQESKIIIVYDSSTSPISCISDIREKYKLPAESQIILFLGRLVKRKGCDTLIKSFSFVAEKLPNCFLLIAGDGEEKTNCESLALASKYPSRIIFAGRVQPEERASYFSESNIFVLPSNSFHGTAEAWGLTVNEALEQGTPVIASNVVGAAYDLLDNQCGSIFEEKNEKQLSTLISKYLSKDQLELRKYCKAQYEKYSVSNMADGFFKTFKLIAN